MSLISVIIPVYNGEGSIAEAIGSVGSNGYDNLEIVVIDDCSTDATVDLVRSLAEKDCRIRLLQTSCNMGPAGARNLGLEHASGEWVTLNDADDWWVEGRISALLGAAKRHDADVVLDNMLLYDHVLEKVYDRTRFAGCDGHPSEVTPGNVFFYDDMFNLTDRRHKYNSIGFSQPFIRREFLLRHQISYLDRYRSLEDLFFLVNMVMAGAKTVVVPEAYYVYRLPVSPSSGEKSPFSHTRMDLQSVERFLGDLLEMYKDVLPSELGAHFLYLRKKIDCKILLGKGDYARVLGYFLREPGFFMAVVFRLLKRNVVEFG